MAAIYNSIGTVFYLLLILHLGACQEDFCYAEAECGPQTWGGLCSRGTQQSPVALAYNFVDFLNGEERELLQSGAYLEQQSFFIENNGNTVSIRLRLDLTSTTYLSGSLLGGSYVFSQLHFHWGSDDQQGSEHIFDGIRKPMEAHFVHYANRYPGISEALTSNTPGAVTVFAVIFDISDSDNPALNPIIRELRKLHNANPEVRIQSRGLVLTDLLCPNTLREVEVIQYDGSLTTPDCAEVVLWNLMIPTIPISQNQLNEFRRLRNRRGRPLSNNFRPLQNLNGRVLRYFRTSIPR
ncbi:unnamed protein product [Allacma fusca]|uniref:Alpha-carbonic anhydrase domain-containing protein n=1 Tax=Allacma fusca TaxID=39272 RepID=A0A8J2K0E5_9HEXA|nr:unnamed protein product [Allacma fusca]